MSYRVGLFDAVVNLFNSNLNGTNPDYTSNIYGNASRQLVFYSEVNDFPFVSVTGTRDSREYQPGGLIFINFGMMLRLYVRDADPQPLLDALLRDIELLIERNPEIQFTESNGDVNETIDIQINTVETDEGLLADQGYAVGEVSMNVFFEKHRRFPN